MSKRIAKACIDTCDYLNKYDSDVQQLANHCECSVPHLRRALDVLRDAGAPLEPVRHTNSKGVAEHYWRLGRVLIEGEAEAFTSFAFLPRERAEILLRVVQEKKS